MSRPDSWGKSDIAMFAMPCLLGRIVLKNSTTDTSDSTGPLCNYSAGKCPILADGEIVPHCPHSLLYF